MTKHLLPGWTLLSMLAFTLAACQSLGMQTTEPAPAMVDTLIPTETPTIVWFPPTNTPTPALPLAPSATPNDLPGTTGVTFTDDFSDPSHWQISSSSQAASIIEGNRLILVVREAGASIMTLRDEPLLRNFYVEVTARTSLCSSDDDYGILFRTASGMDYYRYALACDGTERVDRVRTGQSSPLQMTVNNNTMLLEDTGFFRNAIAVNDNLGAGASAAVFSATQGFIIEQDFSFDVFGGVYKQFNLAEGLLSFNKDSAAVTADVPFSLQVLAESGSAAKWQFLSRNNTVIASGTFDTQVVLGEKYHLRVQVDTSSFAIGGNASASATITGDLNGASSVLDLNGTTTTGESYSWNLAAADVALWTWKTGQGNMRVDDFVLSSKPDPTPPTAICKNVPPEVQAS